jgi:hypothetical protein
MPYDWTVRTNIPERIALLSENCAGFTRPIDTKTEAYATFMRVVNKRNFALHGNVDPIAERIETIYFEGRRPLFVNTKGNLGSCSRCNRRSRRSSSPRMGWVLGLPCLTLRTCSVAVAKSI